MVLSHMRRPVYIRKLSGKRGFQKEDAYMLLPVFSALAMRRLKGNNKSGLDLKNKNLRFTKPD